MTFISKKSPLSPGIQISCGKQSFKDNFKIYVRYSASHWKIIGKIVTSKILELKSGILETF